MIDQFDETKYIPIDVYRVDMEGLASAFNKILEEKGEIIKSLELIGIGQSAMIIQLLRSSGEIIIDVPSGENISEYDVLVKELSEGRISVKLRAS